MHPDARRHAEHVNPAFIKLLGLLGYGRVFVRAQGAELFDSDGKAYLDFLAAFGTVNVGHNHPRLVASLHAALDAQLVHFCHVGPAVMAARLAEALARVCGLPLALFTTSGAEAVEAGIKLARAATGRRPLVSAARGFHGTNLGVLSVMDERRMRAPFEPLLADCVQVPFGDLAALQRALREHHPAAFVVEPIQAEAGVELPPPGYLARAQAACRAHGTIMVLDEVQTGLGRTGAMFAHQHDGFVPDVLCLAKALSGGMVPVACAMTSAELFDRAYGSMDRFDLHGSTFAGGALAAVAGMTTLEILAEERLPERAAELGERLLRGLRTRLGGHPLVKEVRGRGLLVGVELGATRTGLLGKLAGKVVDAVAEKFLGQWFSLKLLEHGLVCQPASQQWDVLKLQPPLTITAAELDRGLDIIARVFDDSRDVTRILAQAGSQLGKQWRKGWDF